MTPCEALRAAIDAVIRQHDAVPDQVVAFESLRAQHPHSIRPANIADYREGGGEPPEYDCFAFALDMVDCPERIAVRQFAPHSTGPVTMPGIQDVLPAGAFLQSLLLPEQPDLESGGDGVVVYYDKSGKSQHAGKLLNGTVVSKWGMKGGLWRHGVWEVPTSYGNSAKFYLHRSAEDIRKAWIQYLGRLAVKVAGFITLVNVIGENESKHFSAETLTKLAREKWAARR